MFLKFLNSVNNIGTAHTAGDAISLQVVVNAIAFVLCLLIRCALPQNFISAVGLSLGHPKKLSHCVSFADETIMARAGGKVKGVVTVCYNYTLGCNVAGAV